MVLLKKFITETPEHISGQEQMNPEVLDAEYLEELQAMIDDDNADREELLNLAKANGLLVVPDLEFRGSASRSPSIGEDLVFSTLAEAELQLKSGPGRLMDIGSQETTDGSQETIDGPPETVFNPERGRERSPSIDYSEEEKARKAAATARGPSKKPFGGGKRRQTKKRKLTKRRKNKKSNTTKRNRKMTKRRR
jgi:hypothetical protein